jgi:hypothetical protein
MNRIMRFSSRLHLATRGLFWLLLLVWVVMSALSFTTPWISIDDLIGRTTGLNEAPASARAVALGMESIVMALGLYAIHQLAKLLALYARGSIFTHASTLRLRKFGLVLFAIPFVDTLEQLGIDGVSYLVNTTGPGFQLHIDISLMLFGAVFTLLAQIMVEATTISDEARLTV